MAAPTTTVDQGAMRALAAWLTSQLPEDVSVSPTWVAPGVPLAPKQISIVFTGASEDEYIEPTLNSSANIHDRANARVVVASAIDVPTAITAINAARTSYEAHRIDITAHGSADTTNVVLSPIASDQTTAETLANELRALLVAHAPSSFHAQPDEKAAASLASYASARTSPAALFALTNALVQALNVHYVARVYFWRLRARALPVQLDVWATYEATRDDLMARLEPLLNIDTTSLRAGPRNGVLLDIAEWPSARADFDFGSPRRMQSSDSQVRGEFRASYAGKAEFWLLVRTQLSRMTSIQFKQAISAALTPPTGLPSLIATVAVSTAAPGSTTTYTEQ